MFILRSKGTTLGRVEFERLDWPWNYGRFYPSKAFSPYATIFAEADRLRTAGDSERQERDRFVRQIVEMELQLVREESGELAGEPDMLWIRGDRVSWRGHSGALRSAARTQQ
jgi:hypothetical protein